jgi:hypothetical protein
VEVIGPPRHGGGVRCGGRVQQWCGQVVADAAAVVGLRARWLAGGTRTREVWPTAAVDQRGEAGDSSVMECQ